MKKTVLVLLAMILLSSCYKEEISSIQEVNIDYVFELQLGLSVDEVEAEMDQFNEFEFYYDDFDMSGELNFKNYINSESNIVIRITFDYSNEVNVYKIIIPYESLNYSDIIDMFNEKLEVIKPNMSWSFTENGYTYRIDFDEESNSTFIYLWQTNTNV